MWPNNLAGTFGRCGGMLMFPLTSYQESLASNTVDVDGHNQLRTPRFSSRRNHGSPWCATNVETERYLKQATAALACCDEANRCELCSCHLKNGSFAVFVWNFVLARLFSENFGT